MRMTEKKDFYERIIELIKEDKKCLPKRSGEPL